VEERAAASKRELEELAALVVLLSTRVERLFQLCAANHQRSDEVEALCRQTRSDLRELSTVVFNTRTGRS
jgi:hypothetical protein